MNPAEWLQRTAHRVPDAPALLRGETVIADYAEFARRAAAIGAALKTVHGIAPGDRVALFMTNRTDYLELLYGVWFCGAVVVPINAKLHVREAAWIIDNSGAKLAFVSQDIGAELSGTVPDTVEVVMVDDPSFDALRQAEPLVEPARFHAGDTLWLFYTSGTTGKPKGVMMTSANIQAMTLSYFVDVDEVKADDAILYAAPISHGAGLYNFMHVLRGARHVVPESGGFDPAEILRLAPRLKNVSMFAAPTMVRRLIDRAKMERATGEGIRTVVYGGGPMYLADIVEAVEVMGPRFVQIYGQGECPMAISALSRDHVADRGHPRWRERLASVGSAQSCARIMIADDDGHELPRGEIGEILVQGIGVMAGYWNNPEATAGTLRDGWLWTGDRGAMDDDGFLTLHDRSKDVIISGGTNIYPREVEEALLLHPAVHEAAAVGRPHPDWGEEVVAFVVPASGHALTATELDRHCLDHIARFKRPKDYIVVDELPKNNYGKVLKTALRKRLGETK